MTEEIMLKLNDGVTMMLIGMGTVLLFLCTMIVCMIVMSWAVAKINKIFPEAVPAISGGAKKISSGDDSEIAAAIVAAMFSRK